MTPFFSRAVRPCACQEGNLHYSSTVPLLAFPGVSFQLPAKTWMATALAVGFLAAGLSLFLALRQPWLGLQLTSGEDELVRVQSAQGPSAAIPIGTVVSAFRGKDETCGIEPFDLIAEPDGLMKDFAEYDRFLARQTTLRRLQGQRELTLITAQGEQLTIRPSLKGRPLSDLPPDFWIQVVVGFVAWMISASVFIFRPREQNARYLLLSGAATLVFTTAAACYTTRELGFDGSTFRWACDVNFLGGSLFAASFVALLLYYPRRLAPRWVGLTVVAVFVIWFVLQQCGAFESMTFARRFLVMLGVLSTFILAAVQWFATRALPVARAALQWFLLSWLLGTTLFATFILLPQMFGVDTSSVQGYAFSLFLLVYGGLAFGILRFRLFDIGGWWRGILVWTGTILFLIVLDLLFLSGLKFSGEISLSLALLISGLFWLPLRGWLWSLMTGRKKEGFGAHFDGLMKVALVTGGPVAQQAAWEKLLLEKFSALEVSAPAEGASSLVLARHGLDLTVPSLPGLHAVRITHAGEGRRLFNQGDLVTTREMVSMLTHILEGLDSYKKGMLQERRRIARDVHDNAMANLLSALHQGELDSKDEGIRGSIRELRKIINNHPTEGPDLQACLATLEAESEKRCTATGIRLAWQTAGLEGVTLGQACLHALTSILRESLTNVMKHAGADECLVEIRHSQDHLALTIKDNGCGLTEKDFTRGEGLANMRSRVEELRGTFSLPATPRGTLLLVQIPTEPSLS